MIGTDRDAHVSASGGGATDRRTLTARRIADLTGGELHGAEGALVSHVATLEAADDAALSFLGSGKYVTAARASRAAVVLVTAELATAVTHCAARIVVQNPQQALFRVYPELYPVSRPRPTIAPTARIGHSARVGAGVRLDDYAVVEDGAVVGDGTHVGAHAVVGANVVVGTDCVLYPQVTVYSGSVLGDRVIVHAGARVGSDGFGYVFANGEHQKIPHVGRCVIESDVEIGANTTIDRGSIGDTLIGAGTKIDNLVQIGHNVQIGSRCLIMAQVGVAGSARIGDGSILAGQVGVSGHLTIGAGARLAAQAGVFGDVPAGETWSGYPARPHREALRAQAALFKLASLWRSLERLVEGRTTRGEGRDA